MIDLTGLHVVVTGGNSGLGLGMALGVARAGANVSIWGRNAERNAEAAAQVAALGVQALPVECDVTDEKDIAAAMDRTIESLGPLGCMVANAGIAGETKLVDTSLDEWHRIMRVNVDGVFLTAREAGRRFVAQDTGGSLVLVSSTASRFGAGGLGAYATSKSAVVGMGRTFAVELARHRVRANVLIPGWTRTAMNEHLQADERFLAATTARTPVRRWATADEFEKVAVFLADPSQTFHTGNEVVVDGGYCIF
ncbi:SDR family NAD(P)-dependent oxidoreductase [Sporichthya polymorpha]|uniref:SDR family NAD(P)-dependent oxidoreductase n=1 Tax=Sporichthya polymorpha TaxID=35751 RepID=UPI0003665036|nr:SDR family oxidoreductase [Sporichthya polymorpha]